MTVAAAAFDPIATAPMAQSLTLDLIYAFNLQAEPCHLRCLPLKSSSYADFNVGIQTRLRAPALRVPQSTCGQLHHYCACSRVASQTGQVVSWMAPRQ